MTAIDFHFIHDHIEMRLGNLDQPRPPASLPCNLPLFHALRVLVVENANSSFLTGHTFHKLERCKVVGSSGIDHIAYQGLFTEMPVCARMDICDPTLLATFRLPQIYELGLDLSVPESSMIWTKYISVNSNLSGLKLLHIWGEGIGGDLVPVFQSLPLLETLIIGSQVNVGTFKALSKSSQDGQILAIPCPKLQTLQIEGTDPSVSPKFIAVLKEFVTQRAQCGSPLRSFTFCVFSSEHPWKFELIGMGGTFTLEKIVLAENTEPFELDICRCDPRLIT